jgi:hypothetical protein
MGEDGITKINARLNQRALLSHHPWFLYGENTQKPTAGR